MVTVKKPVKTIKKKTMKIAISCTNQIGRNKFK